MPQKILIVEDNPVNVKFMSLVLTRKGGYQVLVSEDPAEVLRLAATEDLALILMDISLSGSTFGNEKVDGIWLTRRLKADPATAHIPVILATAHAMYGDRERYLAETGAQAYIAKPIHDPDAFLSEIRKALPPAG